MIKNHITYSRLTQFFQHIEKLIDQSRDVFWVRSFDYSGQIYVSPAYEKIWGRPCESLYKKPENWVDTILPEDQERVKNDIKQRDQNVIAGQKFFQWYRVVRPDGKIRWVEDESFAIFNNDGSHIGFAGIATDITEKKENEMYLQKEKIRAEAISKSKSEFIANMSHDIKTPLSGMIGMTDILISRLKEEKEIDCAKTILNAGHTLMRFLDNCIEMVLSESGDVIFNKEPFFLKSVLHDISSLFQPAAKNKNLSFTIHYPDNVPDFFSGNRAAIYRILLNLVGNAIKFTEKGAVDLQVSINQNSSSPRQCIAKFRIKDTGIGIAEENQKRIFDRYTRLSPSYERLYEGAGIGLSIVKKFVEELGGEICVTSQVGQGSVFLLVLPLEIPLLQAEEYNNQNTELTLAASDVKFYPNELLDTQTLPANAANQITIPGNVSILLVEDNIVAQQVAVFILRDLGYQVQVADCGKKAIELFSQNKYDLVFIDVGLPDVSGYFVIEEIRKIENGKNSFVPIIILTAHATYDVEEKKSGVDSQEMLSKPLSKDKAREIVERYVANSASVQT